jgi:ribosomal protein L17
VLQGKGKNMFVRFYQNKCSKFLIIFLSKNYYKRDMGYAKIMKRGHKRGPN